MEDDVKSVLPDIEQNYRTARNARSILKFNDTLFKYRVPSSDMKRGSSGAFRLCGYYHAETNTLYLLLIWLKCDTEDLDFEVKNKAVKELQRLLRDVKTDT